MIEEVVQRRARLAATFALVARMNDQELQSEFAKYLCVLVSGFLEQAVRDILLSYASLNSDQFVARYVEGTVERTNLNAKRLEEIVGRFSNDWQQKLHAYIVDERRAALGNIVTQRNAIAHGRDSTITLQQVRDYYDRINEVLDFLVDLTFHR